MVSFSDATPPEDVLKVLRDAVLLAPDNVALRQYLAETLFIHGQIEEAEKYYRTALEMSPDNLALKLGLARTFYQLGKPSHALVIIEDLVKSPQAPAYAFLMHARLLAGSGEMETAVQEYRRAVELDRTVADPEFAARLGIRADE